MHGWGETGAGSSDDVGGAAGRESADLAAIRRLMEENRNVVEAGGKHLVWWGLLTAAGMGTTWLLVRADSWAPIPWVWVGAVAVGWVLSVAAGRRDARRAPVRTMGTRLGGAIWMAFGGTATLVGLLGPASGALPVQALPGVMGILLGGAFFTSGFLPGIGWLRFVGLGWWATGAVMLWMPGVHTLLLLAGLVVVLQVVPGAMLAARSGRVEPVTGKAA